MGHDWTLAGLGSRLPEGPVVMPDGRLVFCDGNIGELSLYAGGVVSSFALMGGSPWGAGPRLGRAPSM